MIEPLKNTLVIDFSQFLSGPCCTLRLADLGADVIKIEKPISGDICRQLYVSNVIIDGESSLFHAINRNKKSFAADLKSEAGLKAIKKLLLAADVLVHNFRPGVMERLGLGYDEVKLLKPSIIYACISGYGDLGEWAQQPGQDLLLQAVSGLGWLSGNASDGPVPMGASVVDSLAGTYLAQGIMAALFKRNNTKEGSLVQVSMLESSLDFQFEVFTTYLNDGHQLPTRSAQTGANAYLAAPYGIYTTTDGFMALAMAAIDTIASLIDCPALAVYINPADWYTKRDEIKQLLANHLRTNTTDYWLSKLEPADIWCAQVLDYQTLSEHEGYKSIEMEQQIHTACGSVITTTRCPIRINGELLKYNVGAPALGQDNESITTKYQL